MPKEPSSRTSTPKSRSSALPATRSTPTTPRSTPGRRATALPDGSPVTPRATPRSRNVPPPITPPNHRHASLFPSPYNNPLPPAFSHPSQGTLMDSYQPGQFYNETRGVQRQDSLMSVLPPTPNREKFKDEKKIIPKQTIMLSPARPASAHLPIVRPERSSPTKRSKGAKHAAAKAFNALRPMPSLEHGLRQNRELAGHLTTAGSQRLREERHHIAVTSSVNITHNDGASHSSRPIPQPCQGLPYQPNQHVPPPRQIMNQKPDGFPYFDLKPLDETEPGIRYVKGPGPLKVRNEEKSMSELLNHWMRYRHQGAEMPFGYDKPMDAQISLYEKDERGKNVSVKTGGRFLRDIYCEIAKHATYYEERGAHRLFAAGDGIRTTQILLHKLYIEEVPRSHLFVSHLSVEWSWEP